MIFVYRIFINFILILSPLIILVRLLKKKEDLVRFREKLGLDIVYSPCYLPIHSNPQRLFKEDKEALQKLYAGNKNLEQVYTNFISKDEPPIPRIIVDYNTTLDKYRNTKFFDVFPQYRKYRR